MTSFPPYQWHTPYSVYPPHHEHPGHSYSPLGISPQQASYINPQMLRQSSLTGDSSMDFHGRQDDGVHHTEYTPTTAGPSDHAASNTADPEIPYDRNQKPVSKRKRLTKACDSCHKSKRRCDGTKPCMNCEYANKPCKYTDANGNDVGPSRVRKEIKVAVYQGSDGETITRSPTPVPVLTDNSPCAIEPGFAKSLVSAFFAYCHPGTAIFHRPTFLNDFAHNAVPPFLLLTIYALAAQWCDHPALDEQSSWQAGEQFASLAKKEIFRKEFAGEHNVHLPDSLDSLRIQQPLLELAQALCLLQLYETGMRRADVPDGYLGLALQLLYKLRVLDIDMPSSNTNETYKTLVTKEATRRTFWLVYILDTLSAGFTGRVSVMQREELNGLRLPMEEALFEFPRHDMRAGTVLHHEYLPFPETEHRTCNSEFADLVRITNVYGAVMRALAVKQGRHLPEPGAPEELPGPINGFEAKLTGWLQTLPEQLYLTEYNLRWQMSQLETGSGAGAWCYAFMHTLAECTVLALHEFVDPTGYRGVYERPHTIREKAALSNLTMIYSQLTDSARKNILMVTVLWPLAKLGLQNMENIDGWLDTYESKWGISRADVLSQDYRLMWYKTIERSPSLQGTSQMRGSIDAGPQLPYTPSLHYGDYGTSGSSRKRKISEVDVEGSYLNGDMSNSNTEEARNQHIRHAQTYTVGHGLTDGQLPHVRQGSVSLESTHLRQSIAGELPREGGFDGVATAGDSLAHYKSHPPHAPEASSNRFLPTLPHPSSLTPSQISQHSQYPQHIHAQRLMRDQLPHLTTTGLNTGSVTTSSASPSGGSAHFYRAGGYGQLGASGNRAISDDGNNRSESDSPMDSFHRGSFGSRSFEREGHASVINGGVLFDDHRRPTAKGLPGSKPNGGLSHGQGHQSHSHPRSMD